MTASHAVQISKLMLLKRGLARCLLVPCLLLCVNPVSASVVYRVTFTGTWNDSDVTGAIPASAHFTGLFGATHADGQALWEPGTLATVGIENVAEIGNNLALNDEINAAITDGTVAAAFQAADLSSFPSSTSTTIEVLDTHPYVTAISMVAPSPDWFVGVSNLSLMIGGNWMKDLTVDLMPWDAGTEEGTLFSLSNPASNPHTSIAAPVGSPFIGLPVIGTLRFELLTGPVPVAACTQADTKGTWRVSGFIWDVTGKDGTVSFKCKLRIGSGGGISASKSSCKIFSEGKLNVTGGNLGLASNCAISGKIKTKPTVFKFRSGQMDRSRKSFSIVGVDDRDADLEFILDGIKQ